MSYQPKVYLEQGGDALVVQSGGEIRIEAGGIFSAGGTQASAIADLTDNSAGTANSTIQAMADLTDTPADADTLRDDIVATLLPAIRNNFADVAAKVNAIIAALEGAGIIAS